jgi:iron complex transport system ATP-binding protein
MLHASEISVRREGERILDDVSVSIIGGEVVALVGPSGAGKSTLLQALSGDIKPSSGEVWMAGKPMHHWSLRERALRRAVLPQFAHLELPMTVLDVVLLGRTPHNAQSTTSNVAIADAALLWVRANGLRQRLYTTLAAGERQRVQLARVLAQSWGRAKNGDCYVFLDEPAAGLDMLHQHQTLSVAKQLAHEGAAVVVVLHDLNLAAQYCDRLILLRSGRLLAEGRADEVLVEPTIRATFGMDALITRHPTLPCPMVVPLATTAQMAGPRPA